MLKLLGKTNLVFKDIQKVAKFDIFLFTPETLLNSAQGMTQYLTMKRCIMFEKWPSNYTDQSHLSKIPEISDIKHWCKHFTTKDIITKCYYFFLFSACSIISKSDLQVLLLNQFDELILFPPNWKYITNVLKSKFQTEVILVLQAMQLFCYFT